MSTEKYVSVKNRLNMGLSRKDSPWSGNTLIVVSKEGHTDSLLWHEKTYLYGFHWQKCNYKLYSLSSTTFQNSVYLLNDSKVNPNI